ncbi:APC amino acid permease [Punctularia strigosozonata HHB-11173 SS5]|uniref:APC amino acid permease n=1 Tax=Punctularia strigosozonata (strain HHB-11173) TaxID=741275 RepID=UPI0004417C32|nr:APC amino acid permease [Punctularia strigosozonata HHB-11173 SS5]EIN06876.1 APC amino acid permease [Punctularia strigosozonata HHB-11173 SS5]
MESDEAELARMGYKQELHRDLTLLQNFGVSFSIISVITGIPSLFLYGLTTGGPAVMVWGWVAVAFFTMCVGMAMAEVCSAHPTSGGPYFWAAMLSPPERAAFASWVTGWFNLLGQVAVTTGISYACANFISTAASLGTSFEPNSHTVIGVYAAVLIAQGLINTFGVHLLKYLNNISVWWHAIGTTALVIAILAAAPKHQSAKFVFTQFIDGTGVDGVGWGTRASHAYVVVIGILMAQYTLTGFDASAHMTEETHNAAMSGSLGIIMAIGVSAVLGWFLILGLLFSMQDYDATVASATGQPVTQIFLDTVGEKGAIVLMVIVIGAMFFCGTFSITSNSRMMYAFSRDGAIPGHKFLAKVSARTRTPIRTVWLACTLSFILGLPSLGSAVAFSAATSIATIGLYISYAIPIALRVIYRKHFVRGPFHLGAFSYPVALISVTWIAFIAIAFILPAENPVSSQTLNYSIVAVGIVITYSMGFWLLSARKWFIGPVKQIEGEAKGIDVVDQGVMESEKEREMKNQ